jgi:hypothetical protein
MAPVGNRLGIRMDSDEGPAACSPYPEGISADTGSRSAPRVHVGKGNNPGMGCSLPNLRTPPGYGFQTDTPFPGCVLRKTRGYRLPSLRDARTPEAWEWVWDRLDQGSHPGLGTGSGTGRRCPHRRGRSFGGRATGTSPLRAMRGQCQDAPLTRPPAGRGAGA